MGFEKEYQAFMNTHLQARTGERLRRLQEGHNQAELLFLKQVWWPLFHQFRYLHPEYEVDDFKDGKRYLDLLIFVLAFEFALRWTGMALT